MSYLIYSFAKISVGKSDICLNFKTFEILLIAESLLTITKMNKFMEQTKIYISFKFLNNKWGTNIQIFEYLESYLLSLNWNLHTSLEN